MPVIRCRGIVSVITHDESTLDERDTWTSNDTRFYTVPLSLAQNYVLKKKTVPLFLLHNKRYRVGTVHSFSIEKRKLDNRMEDVLVTNFTITNNNFIKAIQKCTRTRFEEVKPTPYISSDGFINAPPKRKKGRDIPELDITAHVALLQRFPGLSLGHNVKTLNVNEMSRYLAGARDMTVLTEAEYDVNDDEDDTSENKDSVDDYINVFASLLSTSNGPLNDKAASDILSIPNLPVESVLHYSQEVESPKSHIQVEEEKTETPQPMHQPNQSHFDPNYTHSLTKHQDTRIKQSNRKSIEVDMDTNNPSQQNTSGPSRDFLYGFYSSAMAAKNEHTNTPTTHQFTQPTGYFSNGGPLVGMGHMPQHMTYDNTASVSMKRPRDSSNDSDDVMVEIKRLREMVEGGLNRNPLNQHVQHNQQPPQLPVQPPPIQVPANDAHMKDIMDEMKRLKDTVAVFSHEREQNQLLLEKEKLQQAVRAKEEQERATVKAMCEEFLSSEKAARSMSTAVQTPMEVTHQTPQQPLPSVSSVPVCVVMEKPVGNTPEKENMTNTQAISSETQPQVQSEVVPPTETTSNFSLNTNTNPVTKSRKKNALQTLRSNICNDSFLFNRRSARQQDKQNTSA